MKCSETYKAAPYFYNCAQAVVARFRPELLEAAGSCGGGRAPEGLCGALYGAMMAEPEKAEEIKAAFAEAAGAVTCRQLKGECKTPCVTCIDIAEQLLTELQKH